MKKGYLNGYARYEAGGRTIEGLFDQGRYMYERKNEIDGYNVKTSILA